MGAGPVHWSKRYIDPTSFFSGGKGLDQAGLNSDQLELGFDNLHVCFF